MPPTVADDAVRRLRAALSAEAEARRAAEERARLAEERACRAEAALADPQTPAGRQANSAPPCNPCPAEELRRLEEERRYVLSSARCLLWLADVAGSAEAGLTYWDTQFPDPVAAQRFVPIAQEPGVPFFRAWYAARLPEDTEVCERIGREAILAGRDYQQEFRVRLADGSIRWMHEDVHVETLEPGRHWRLVGVCTDIDDRKRAQAEIESLNARLQWAVSETHHRVKNHLQVVAAMIDVQADEHGDTIPAARVRALSQQVRGLAAIHELLTEQSRAGGGAEELPAGEALRRLLPVLEAATTGRHILPHIDEVVVPARQGTALAIIANELVTNAVKHARGDIELRLEVEDGDARLVVEDDGPGFRAGFDASAEARTGLELVRMLATWDLDGSVAFETPKTGGARVVVSFPVQPARAAV